MTIQIEGESQKRDISTESLLFLAKARLAVNNYVIRAMLSLMDELVSEVASLQALEARPWAYSLQCGPRWAWQHMGMAFDRYVAYLCRP